MLVTVSLGTLSLLAVAFAAGHHPGRWLVWIAVGFTAGAGILGCVLARTLAGPLRRLAQATARLGAGDGGVRVALEGHDEVAAQKNEEIAALNAQLEQRNQTLTAIVNTSPLAIWTLNRDGNVTSWNPAAEHLFGWRESEVLGRPHPIVPEDKQEEFQQRETLVGIELRRRKKDHSPVDISLATAPLRDPEGAVVGAVSVAADITDRKRAEEEVRRVTRALRVLSQCNQILIRATEEHELLQGICRMIVGVGGYRFAWVAFAEDDEAEKIRPVVHAGHEEGYLALLDLTWADAERSGLPIGMAVRSGKPAVMRDMQSHPALAARRAEMVRRGYASAVALPLIAAEHSLGVLVVYAEEPDGFDAAEVELLAELADDLAYGIIALRTQAERARAEEELRQQRDRLFQAEKLAAMGELLAGVAHEMNNPLSVVLGHTALLKRAAAGSPAAERATKIADAAERSVRIVRNFLALARRRPPERQEVRVNQVVQEALELLAYPLRVDTVEVQLDLADDLPVLWADPHQLHQVVVNLVSNAHQAIREGPTPRRITCTSGYNAAHTRVVLQIADTGPGIPPEVQRRIFEPFFTTKPVGHGTGLGLSISQGIIEAHGGCMHVESEPGLGATFVIELPVAAPAGPESKVETAAVGPQVQGKPILVVDDETQVASVLAEMLAVDGHEVTIAANGAIALDELGKRRYDLILSDIRMPELDGPGLYRALERRDPDALRRFIFVTGDVLTPETRAFLERIDTPVLDKPFALEQVQATVQRVLRSRDVAVR